jgi:hypothetical protein
MPWIATLLVTAVLAGCGRTVPVTPAESASSRHKALVADFQSRVAAYMDLRARAAGGVTPLESQVDPAAIRAAQATLADRIRSARPGARHGDILTPAIRSHFRALLAPELAGDHGRDLRARLQDDAPEPGAVPLEVNALYPPGTPFPTTPIAVLQALPPLPRGLEYRVIGRDLVLLDQPANVIVDYMRNALPTRPASSGG